MSTATKPKPEQRIFPDRDSDGYSFHAYSSTTDETYHIEVQVYEHGTVAANCTCPGYYHRKQCWHSTLAIETVSGQAQVRALKEELKEITMAEPMQLHPDPETVEGPRYMDAEMAKALREPFPAEQIGKLPKPTKRDNQKGKCNECGGYHGLPAVHLDYVGHATVTARLLGIDPFWNWRPVAFDDDGLPRFVRGNNGAPIGLWIELTIGGVTRLGYGSVESGVFDAEKQLIGDALRNAAMRFGVALDLWAKEDLWADTPESPPTPRQQPPARPTGPVATAAAPATSSDMDTNWNALEQLRAEAHMTAAVFRPFLGGNYSKAALAGYLDANPEHTIGSLMSLAQGAEAS